jgi:predicted DsbA family dithiol-disulfide isomerase
MTPFRVRHQRSRKSANWAYIDAMHSLRVDVWSDIACPWCYIGKRRLEAALRDFSHRDHVRVRWHAFELDPSAPAVRNEDTAYAQRLAKKYGMSVAEAEQRLRDMTKVAAADGLEFHFERVRAGNTFNAHRVLHLAGQRGVQDAVKERLLRGYMTEGQAIGQSDVLVRLGSEAGLDADELSGLLASDLYAAEVRADEQRAHALGIQGVPFFVLGERYGVSGAQAPAVLLRALEQAWAEVAAADASSVDGAVCGPDGCA